MGRHRIKKCPDCNENVPSTAIICECGGSLVLIKSGSESSFSSDRSPQTRRTERTKRVKPSFYDSLEVEKAAKAKKRRCLDEKIANTAIPTSPSVEKQSAQSTCSPPAHRMQLTVVKKVAEEQAQVKEEELEEIVLTDEKRAKFSLILDDINRKICASSWKGII